MEELDKLIVDNQKLVYYVFNRYLAKFEICRTYREDVIGEGFLGLVKAANSFDSSRGNSFVSFAYPSVLNSMRMAVRRLRKDWDRSCSLESPMGNSGDYESQSFLEVLEGPDVFKQLEDEEERLNQEDERVKLIEELSPQQKLVLNLKLEGKTNKQIAEEMGITYGGVNGNFMKAKANLRKKIGGIKMRQTDPAAPNRKDYESLEEFRKEYQRYYYYKSRGRISEYLRIKGQLDPTEQSQTTEIKEEVKEDGRGLTGSVDVVIAALNEKEQRLIAEIELIRKTKKAISKVLL